MPGASNAPERIISGALGLVRARVFLLFRGRSVLRSKSIILSKRGLQERGYKAMTKRESWKASNSPKGKGKGKGKSKKPRRSPAAWREDCYPIETNDKALGFIGWLVRHLDRVHAIMVRKVLESPEKREELISGGWRLLVRSAAEELPGGFLLEQEDCYRHLAENAIIDAARAHGRGEGPDTHTATPLCYPVAFDRLSMDMGCRTIAIRGLGYIQSHEQLPFRARFPRKKYFCLWQGQNGFWYASLGTEYDPKRSPRFLKPKEGKSRAGTHNDSRHEYRKIQKTEKSNWIKNTLFPFAEELFDEALLYFCDNPGDLEGCYHHLKSIAERKMPGFGSDMVAGIVADAEVKFRRKSEHMGKMPQRLWIDARSRSHGLYANSVRLSGFPKRRIRTDGEPITRVEVAGYKISRGTPKSPKGYLSIFMEVPPRLQEMVKIWERDYALQ